jgi:thiamine-phosphate pyrophosphorylase
LAVPLVAIGGIDLDTAPAVLEAGADSVAVIADLLCGPSIRLRVRAYLDALGTAAN